MTVSGEGTSRERPSQGRGGPEPVRLVPWSGLVPEPLADFFGRQTPWTWRHLRTVFCRFSETRRLANILRTIDLVLEKAPHTLARGHWSISGYQDARRKLEGAIAKLGHLANQVAADARVRQPVQPERDQHQRKIGGLFQKIVGGVKKTFAPGQEAA